MSQTDFETQPYNAQYSEQPAKSGCGCWAWGCLSVLVIGVLGTVGISVGGYMFLTKQVQTYTAEAPKQLPTVEYEPEKLAELQQRLDNFKKAAEEETKAEELVLSATDINALIQSNEELKGKVFTKIEDGLVSGEISVPTDMIPGGKGRFFNANATFDVSMQNGVLIVTLKGAEVKGEPVPAQFIDAMSKENLARDAYKDPETAEMMRRVDSISVEGDRIILKLREKAKLETDSEKVPATEKVIDAVIDEAADEATPNEADAELSTALE